jgi:hypothetical protein
VRGRTISKLKKKTFEIIEFEEQYHKKERMNEER